MWRDKYGKTGMELSLDSNMHLQQIYDLMGSGNNLKPAAAAPAAAPAPLMPQISAASQQYRADTDARNAAIDKKITDFNASEAAATKARKIAEQTRVRNFATQSANQARSGQTANLQIQPASSTPKTAGTQTFKKRRIASNRKQQLTSGINLGTSSLLNI
jgi:hypothetical protein